MNFIVRLLLGRKKSYCKLMKIKGELYKISIQPYEPVNMFFGRIEKALQKQGFML